MGREGLVQASAESYWDLQRSSLFFQGWNLVEGVSIFSGLNVFTNFLSRDFPGSQWLGSNVSNAKVYGFNFLVQELGSHMLYSVTKLKKK